MKLDINSLEELKKLVKSGEYMVLEHSIKPSRVEKIKKLIKKVIKEEKNKKAGPGR